MKIRVLLGQFKSIFISKRFVNTKKDNDSYWEHRSLLTELNEFQADRVNFLINNIEEDSSVLDAGCGPGTLLEKLAKARKITPTGLDNSKISIESLEEKGINSVFSEIDVLSLSKLNKYDYILFLEVLEHLPNPEEIISLSIEKAEKGVFISVPNTGYFTHRLRLLFGKFPIQWKVHPGEHLRFWTIPDMLIWIDVLDLFVENHSYYQGIPFLSKLFPRLFSMGQIYKVRKKNA